MKKRKHRVVVEITFDRPCTAKQAAIETYVRILFSLKV